MENIKDILVRCSNSRMVPIGDLKPHPRNPNHHPKEQIDLLAKIIRHQGWRAPVVVSTRSGYVVAGHGRIEAAKRLGLKEVPADLQEFESEADEMAHLVADNKLAELAEMDEQALSRLLLELDGTLDLELAGFTEAALRDLPGFDEEGTVDADPQIDKAEALRNQWGVALGQVWHLGEHRLMCGDSTNASHVGRLLGEERPNLMVTDPPYGVEYDPTWRDEVRDAQTIQTGSVANDDVADWTKAFALFPGDVAYVWHSDLYAPVVFASLESVELLVRSQIIWAKQNMVLSRGAYHWKHEGCWYAVRKGKKSSWIGDRSQTTLWEIKNFNPAGGGSKTDEARTFHGTQKPLECMARPIRHHEGDVFEPFSGSGTTLIACENLRRRCRAMEISPEYVAVVLQRWADATGKTPELKS